VSRRPIPFPFAFRLLPVLVLCFALAAGLQAQRIVLEQAATMRNLPAGELEYKELEGDVVVRYGDSMIRFGFGRYNERDGVLDCVRNVEVHDDGRVLTCDELTLYEKDEKAVARGNVKITGDSMIVHSRLATWWRGLDKVELQTDVEVFDLKDSLKLVCGSAMLDNANGYARASLAPVMTRMGADTLTLKARTLEWWRTEDRALAWKGAELDQKDLKASCDSLVWENGPRVAHLYHTPRILQENREITGDTIRVFLEEEDLDSLSVQGHALVLSPADSVSAKLYDRLEGATLAVSFVEGQASALELAGSADEGLAVAVPLALVLGIAALIASALSVAVFGLFGVEVLLGVAVEISFASAGGALAFRARREGWLLHAAGRTWRPMLILLVLAAVLGVVIDRWMPQAGSLPQAVRLLRGGMP